MTQRSEPMFNVPSPILWTVALFVLVQAIRSLVLSPEQDVDFLLYFAFIPARYDATVLPHGAFPGGLGAEIWTFVTYAFIHGGWIHLAVNTIWYLPFGSAVARRFGTLRFLAFFAVTAAAGAAVHLVTHLGEFSPMVGASAAISGLMAAAIRFIFQRGGPLEMFRGREEKAYRVPALPLGAALRDPRILAFLIVWFGINILFGMGTVPIPGVEESIAWQAHIGGFLAGLILFAVFDPIATHVHPRENGDADIGPTMG